MYPDVVVNVVLIDVSGVELTAALKTASWRVRFCAGDAGIEIRERLSGDSVDDGSDA